MEMLVCQIVYCIVLHSNDFGTVSGRKERVSVRWVAIGVNSCRRDREKRPRSEEKIPTLAKNRTARMGHPKASERIKRRPPACPYENCFALSRTSGVGV